MSKHHLGFRGDRGPVLLAIMVTSGLAALDSTILATAVPSVIKDLGGFGQFPWLFSIYLLAQAVSVPVYAKLSDVVGRKPVVLVGIGLFLAGSLLCGSAWNLASLIVFRALQGLGAGAVLPMSNTIAGDIYTVEERAQVQGYLASVWAISSVLGPTLGGLFSQFLSWRWIFFINLPLGAVAIYLLVKDFREKVAHRSHKVDYLGTGLLTGALSLLILALLEGGQVWAWISVPSLGILGTGTLLFAAFLLVETRAAEPVLPLWVFSRRLLATTSLVSMGIGAVLLGLTSYIPTYLTRTLDVSPVAAGGAIGALMIGWPIAASQSGRVYLRHGFRLTVLVGLSLVSLGILTLALWAADPQYFLVAGCCFVVGLGFGLVGTPIIVAAQSSVSWGERGVVTGTNQFARAVGSSVGVAIFGAVANSVFRQNVGAVPDPTAVAGAMGRVLWVALAMALVTFAVGWLMPKTKPGIPGKMNP